MLSTALRRLAVGGVLCGWALSLAAAPNPTSYGPVQPGELIWRIAGKLRPDKTTSHQQVILALLRHNPDAFSVSCNLNSLKVGALLRVPSLAEVQQISRTEAQQQFTQQAAAWRKRAQIVCPATPQQMAAAPPPAPDHWAVAPVSAPTASPAALDSPIDADFAAWWQAVPAPPDEPAVLAPIPAPTAAAVPSAVSSPSTQFLALPPGLRLLTFVGALTLVCLPLLLGLWYWAARRRAVAFKPTPAPTPPIFSPPRPRPTAEPAVQPVIPAANMVFDSLSSPPEHTALGPVLLDEAQLDALLQASFPAPTLQPPASVPVLGEADLAVLGREPAADAAQLNAELERFFS